MKIPGPDSNSISGLNPSSGVGAPGTGSASKQLVGQDEASDQVSLSSLSSYLAAAVNGSPAHVANLNQLSASLSSGQYHVDAHAVSGSLIQHTIEHGGSSYLGANN
jgi:anti-sigma28 factor (negative regulator of flagellin synthesis)